MNKDPRYIRVSFDTFEYIIVGIIIAALFSTLETPQTVTLRGMLSIVILSVMVCLTAHAITEIIWRLQNK